MSQSKNREFVQKSINQRHRQLNDVLYYLNDQVLDAEREAIKLKLESLLDKVNHNSEYSEGINRLNNEGLIEYEKMLTELYFKMTDGKRAEFYFNNIINNPVFQENKLLHAETDNNAFYDQESNEPGYQMLNVHGSSVWGFSFNPIEDFFNWLGYVGDTTMRLFNLFRAADSGDRFAREHISYLWHQANRQVLEIMSKRSSQVTVAFMAVGAFDAAALSSGIGMISDIVLTIDDVLSGNYIDALGRGGAIVVGVALNRGATLGVNAVVERGLRISVGRNGRYYSLGRRGAMKTKIAMETLIRAEIAAGRFGEVSPQVAGELINMAKLAYDALNKLLNK